MLLDLLTVAVLGLVGVRLATLASRAARSEVLRGRWVEVVRGLRVRHFVPVPFVLTAVLVTALALLRVPGLSLGWWSAIGGTGNVIVGASDRQDFGAAGLVVPIVFLSVLLPLLPLLAEREERMFRAGAEGWSTIRRARRAVEFGLVHLVMGIPIAVALALSVGGAYFTAAYLWGHRRSCGSQEAAVLESTRAHTAYNATILFAALAAFVAVACGVGGGSSSGIEVRSRAFKHNGRIPETFSCKGDNVPPPLSWSGVPSGTKEVALVVVDPDAPRGPFVHWIVTDLPAAASGSLPTSGLHQEANSAGQTGYTGMCPPGLATHRYRFEVLALPKAPSFPQGASPLDKVHALEQAASKRGVLVGRFPG